MQVGTSAEQHFTVGPHDTARALGSGSLDVLATPRLVAWCEAVTCQVTADALAETDTTVGTRVAIDHVKASAVDARLRVRATLAHRDGRLLRFEVVAAVVDGPVVAHGHVTRVVVGRERFLARVVAG